MNFNVGDFVYFTDTTTGSVHRGYIERYQKGRDTRPAFINIAPRDYLVKFDKPLWKDAYDRAWCAAADLTLISKSPSTVTFSTSTTTTKPLNDKDNIKVTTSNKITSSSITVDHNYPWSPYYVTSDDFFDILRVAYDDTYGSKSKCHPEDLYVNVLSVLEVVSNTLINILNLKSGKPLEGIKDNEI